VVRSPRILLHGTAAGRPRGRPRETIEELPSGALRVSVYVGKDPISGRRHYLRETVPAGAGAKKEAEGPPAS
jgi:hypothetical protein